MTNHRNNDYQQHLKGKSPTKGSEEGIKVKYISSPVMVKANNPSEFRAIVQELTGQNSDNRSPGDADTMLSSKPSQNHSHGTSISNPVSENRVLIGLEFLIFILLTHAGAD
ncbi:unnamed protein product [Ilex paraguariensis]|uniref:VQ domain-containing protein n=1 Tax=Ilex paraguariensis TaxID=185542 RepID=A0ABC8TNC8_9AQUA